MGEKQTGPFQLPFNASLKIDFQGSRITSDGGLILTTQEEHSASAGRFVPPARLQPHRGL